MNAEEEKELRDLRTEVISLRDEVKALREFVKGLYSMLNEDEEYEGTEGSLGGTEYGWTNT